MVNWSGHALSQLRCIHDLIAQDSPFYAKRVTEAPVQKTAVLEELPRVGRVVPELDEENVHELPLYSYRILYEIRPAGIAVLAVIHKRQNLQEEDVPRTP